MALFNIKTWKAAVVSKRAQGQEYGGREDPAIGLSPELWSVPIWGDEARNKGAREQGRGESG